MSLEIHMKTGAKWTEDTLFSEKKEHWKIRKQSYKQ